MRIFASLLLVLVIFNASDSQVLAQTGEKINARILPTIWYSSLGASEGDKLKIYAGIQNNSGLNFSGTAFFFVDDEKIAEVLFGSSSGSLREVNTEWTAVKGKHTFQAKVTANLPAGKTLLAYETDKVYLSVSHILTLDEIKEDATETILALGEKIDESAEEFAETLESFKKPVFEKDAGKNSQPKSLLERTSPQNKEVANNALLASVFNSGVDVAKFLVEHWLWTIGGLAALYVGFKLRS